MQKERNGKGYHRATFAVFFLSLILGENVAVEAENQNGHPPTAVGREVDRGLTIQTSTECGVRTLHNVLGFWAVVV